MAETIEQAPTASEPAEFKTLAEFRAYRSKSADFTPSAEEDIEIEAPSAGEEPETAEEPETSDDTTQEIEEPAKPKKKLTLSEEKQRLLDEVTALRKERRELKTPDTITPKVDAPVAPAAEEPLPPFPKLSQFEYDEDKHAEALQAWNLKALERQRAIELKQAQQQQVQTKWNAAVDEARAKTPDFEAVAFGPDVQKFITPVMSDVVVSNSDAQLAYYLGKNPKEAQRISALPPANQIYEMGKLAAKMSTPEKPPTPKPALSVPVTLSAAGGSTTRKELGEAKSMREFRKIKAQLLK